jgi:hypothetical protein
MDSTRSGSCGCGAVRFTTRGPLRGVIFCHCIQCRKQTGHFYAATSVAAERLHVEGEDAITWYAGSPEAKRGFCRICGSALFWKREGADTVSILAGAFDAATGLEGQEHIFVEQKGDYYELADGLPQKMRW